VHLIVESLQSLVKYIPEVCLRRHTVCKSPCETEYLRDTVYAACPLQTLELCANEICDLSELCRDTPPLVHLGLGFNQLTHTHNHLTVLYWSVPLSLLSHGVDNGVVDDFCYCVCRKTLTSLCKLLVY